MQKITYESKELEKMETSLDWTIYYHQIYHAVEFWTMTKNKKGDLACPSITTLSLLM
jgi:hypothetical protein